MKEEERMFTTNFSQVTAFAEYMKENLKVSKELQQPDDVVGFCAAHTMFCFATVMSYLCDNKPGIFKECCERHSDVHQCHLNVQNLLINFEKSLGIHNNRKV